MQGAKDNGIPGILAECGGQCSCATCHCYADAQWAAKLPARQAKEAELIDFVCDPRENSRLSCQILLTESLDGLVLHVPDQQL
jgi:2Fe-2S ferredoxin